MAGAMKLTPEVMRAFVERLAEHGRIERAATQVGLTKQCIYDRMKADAEFAAAVARAKAEGRGKPLSVRERSRVELEKILSDPAATRGEKLRASNQLQVLDRKLGEGRQGASEAEVAPVEAPSKETLATIAAGRSAAMTAMSQFAGLIPLALEQRATGLLAFYHALNAHRGFSIPMHLVPVAIALADNSMKNYQLIIGPGSGKTELISLAWPLWRLGQDQSLTVLHISAGEALVQSFLAAMANTIEHSPVWRAWFPKVTPDKATGWSVERGLFLTGRPRGGPDPNVFAAGLGSSALTGKHARIIVMDDIHSAENSATVEQCEAVYHLYTRQIMGRADPQGCRFVVSGRRWTEDDLYGRLAREGGEAGWVTFRLPAEREGQKDLWFDVTMPEELGDGFRERYGRIVDPVVDEPQPEATAEDQQQ